jgi:phosphoribosylamine-glycine ligase
VSRFFILSEGGDGLGLAVRLQNEGHSVSMMIKDPDLDKRGENIIEKGTLPGFGSIILADCTGSGHALDRYSEAGIPTFGGSQVADKLETDRKFASQVFKRCGIQEPDSKEFTDWTEAENFIKDLGDEVRLVFKPEGKFSGTVPSYVSSDSDDILDYLHHAKSLIGENDPSFVLQEFIDGTCISSEAWYAKDHFVRPTNHTLERKQLMCGDIGPSGGCTGNVVWRCEEWDCPLCRNLGKLDEFLRENSYNGCIDINSVVDKEGNIYALEFTPRFGYDAFPTLLYGLYEGDFGEFLADCASGNGPFDMPLRSGFAAGVRVSVPPWPNELYKSKEGLPLRGLRGNSFESFYPYEVSRFKDELKTSGGVGIIGVAIGYASNVEDAFNEAYKVCDKLRLPDKQFRNDLIETFKSDIRKLKRAFSVSAQTVNT